jgi:type VI secretion system secreted protein Hcp
MSVDYFLKLDGIKGESADSKHKGEIDLESFSWGATQKGTSESGGGGGAGKVQMQDFNFVMRVNTASPKLLLACATGDHIKSAVLVCRKSGGTQQEFLKWTFSDILVSSFQTSGAASHADRDVATGQRTGKHTDPHSLPADQISLNFAKVEFEYKAQKADGTLDGPLKMGYDLKANKAI